MLEMSRARSSTCFSRGMMSSNARADWLLCMHAQFEHLDGHKVKVEASGVTIPGQVRHVSFLK